MKKKRFIATSLLSLAFAGAAAHLEWVGYQYFDREDGPNLLCEIDPGCRHLTADEIMLAESYFGHRIRYRDVKIFNRAWMGIFGHDYDAVTPNGNIYMSDATQRRRNFAQPDDIYSRRIFIHEMTHVAQHQRGMNVPEQALRAYVRSAFNYRATYMYSLTPDAPYGKMNLEQQAEVMADYFSLRDEFTRQTTSMGANTFIYRTNPHGYDWLQARCEEMAPYEQQLKSFFPIVRDSLCPAPFITPPKNLLGTS